MLRKYSNKRVTKKIVCKGSKGKTAKNVARCHKNVQSRNKTTKVIKKRIKSSRIIKSSRQRVHDKYSMGVDMEGILSKNFQPVVNIDLLSKNILNSILKDGYVSVKCLVSSTGRIDLKPLEDVDHKSVSMSGKSSILTNKKKQSSSNIKPTILENRKKRASTNKISTILGNKNKMTTKNKKSTISEEKNKTTSTNKKSTMLKNKTKTTSSNKKPTISENKTKTTSSNKKPTISENKNKTSSSIKKPTILENKNKSRPTNKKPKMLEIKIENQVEKKIKSNNKNAKASIKNKILQKKNVIKNAQRLVLKKKEDIPKRKYRSRKSAGFQSKGIIVCNNEMCVYVSSDEEGEVSIAVPGTPLPNQDISDSAPSVITMRLANSSIVEFSIDESYSGSPSGIQEETQHENTDDMKIDSFTSPIKSSPQPSLDNISSSVNTSLNQSMSFKQGAEEEPFEGVAVSNQYSSPDRIDTNDLTPTIEDQIKLNDSCRNDEIVIELNDSCRNDEIVISSSTNLLVKTASSEPESQTVSSAHEEDHSMMHTDLIKSDFIYDEEFEESDINLSPDKPRLQDPHDGPSPFKLSGAITSSDARQINDLIIDENDLPSLNSPTSFCDEDQPLLGDLDRAKKLLSFNDCNSIDDLHNCNPKQNNDSIIVDLTQSEEEPNRESYLTKSTVRSSTHILKANTNNPSTLRKKRTIIISKRVTKPISSRVSKKRLPKRVTELECGPPSLDPVDIALNEEYSLVVVSSPAPECKFDNSEMLNIPEHGHCSNAELFFPCEEINSANNGSSTTLVDPGKNGMSRMVLSSDTDAHAVIIGSGITGMSYHFKNTSANTKSHDMPVILPISNEQAGENTHPSSELNEDTFKSIYSNDIHSQIPDGWIVSSG